MGRRSSIDTLPQEVRRWLERALTENNFSGYADLEALLRDKGYLITRSSLQRFGYKMEQQLARVRAATEAARLMAREAGDDADDRSAGLMALIQTEMIDILMRLQQVGDNENPSERAKLLATASKNIATLTRASVNLKRFQSEVREKASQAADAAEKIARKGGLSADAVQALRREILGIAT
jgi:Trp operon repressor